MDRKSNRKRRNSDREQSRSRRYGREHDLRNPRSYDDHRPSCSRDDRYRSRKRGYADEWGKHRTQVTGNGANHVMQKSTITRPMGFMRLENLLMQETSENIATVLAANTPGLDERLKVKNDPKMSGLLIGLFAKMIQSEGQPQCIAQVLHLVLQRDFDVKIYEFAHNLAKEQRAEKQQEACTHLMNSLKIMNALLITIPAASENKVSIAMTVLESVLNQVEWWSTDVRDYFTEVKENLERMQEQRTQENEGSTNGLHSHPVPDDFRKIPTFPKLADISGTDQPFLRSNLVNGAYQSTDHYLDVQYRLFREDFIRPLREGINQLKCGHSTGNRRSQNVRVYEDARAEFVIPGRRGITHRLHFGNNKSRRIEWEISRRLMNGNLLCLSSDGFKEDVLFAVVCERKPEDLAKGYLTVQFVTDNEQEGALDAFDIVRVDDDSGDENERLIPAVERTTGPRVSFQKVYTMVESQAFFEAYRHVLAAIKELQTIPLQRYIVCCQKDVESPKYLADVEKEVYYDFSMLTCEGDFERVDVFDRNAWPPADKLKLNESQVQALQLALTSEMVIIQGPPGTGKTHVGLAIMKVLLGNKKIWFRTERDVHKLGANCPILVVCYTNHALDQFLEGIAKYSHGREKIIRLGGRCKNEITEKFSLHKMRQNNRASIGPQDAVIRSQSAAKRNLYEIRDRLQRNLENFQSSQYGILKMEVLSQHIPTSLLQQFCFENQNEAFGQDLWWVKALYNDALLLWLDLERVAENDDFIYVCSTQSKTQSKPKQQPDSSRKDYKNDGIEDEVDFIEQQRFFEEEYSDWIALDESNEKDDDAMEGTSRSFLEVPEQANKAKDIEIHREAAIKRRLQRGPTMSEAEEDNVQNIYSLSMDDRWRLYRTWIGRWRETVRTSPDADIKKYDGLTRVQEEIDMRIDSSILRKADVIAATTTGAAKYRKLLYNLNCKIVVVEEAAEVLEAHVVTAMPKSTEHLILIGDHKQLRPSPNVYDLAKNYKLDVSLFERLIKKVTHVTLTTQHRMRPEIADLLRPRIYQHLQDHHTVENRGGITGIEKPVFFLSHTVPEDKVEDGHSKMNKFEADFLIALCEYIIVQGYRPEQITILAMYNGQIQAFRTSMRNKDMAGKVRVTAVDNFQGEENDIILLSLVRSNYRENIGFLSSENRICVALSRAKCGLYCVGNMELLASKCSMWRNIVCHLREKGSIGDVMMLRCKNHPEALSPVRKAIDFAKVPEGGCGKECGLRLDCGHVCPRPCHPDDHKKSTYPCRKPCVERPMCLCGQAHKCGMKCGEPCKPISEEVEKIIPACEHVLRMACHKDPSTAVCSELMEVLLPCDHQTSIECSQTKNLKSSSCKEKCQKLLSCEHYCKGYCQECFQGRLHTSCEHKCGRILVCGHTCKSMCSTCPPCNEKCKTKCKHSQCSKACGEPCVQCKEKCDWKCPHFKCTKLCGEPCNRPPCNEPCPKKIACGHPCIGLCGEPCPNLCKICDETTVQEIFFGDEDEENARFVQLEDCKHVFTYQSLDTWMEQNEEGNAVKMKECPRCKVTVWRSTRYGGIINDLISSLNKVKTKIWGSNMNASRARSKLLAEIEKAIEKNYLPDDRNELQYIRAQIKKRLPLHEIMLLEEKFRRLQTLEEVSVAARKRLDYIGFNAYNKSTAIEDDLRSIKKWVLRSRSHTTDQDGQCFQREISRIKDMIKFVVIEARYGNKVEQKKYSDSANVLEEDIARLRELLMESVSPYDKNKKAKAQDLFKSISEKAPGPISDLGISNEEKKMICSAMGFARKGHWYKCPNGHVYCIGDCGGATQVAQCPECKVQIGGTSHLLLQSNSVASEMDGGTRSAYDVQDNRVPDDLLADLRRQGFG